jgi:hypothetical protein
VSDRLAAIQERLDAFGAAKYSCYATDDLRALLAIAKAAQEFVTAWDEGFVPERKAHEQSLRAALALLDQDSE